MVGEVEDAAALEEQFVLTFADEDVSKTTTHLADDSVQPPLFRIAHQLFC